MAAMAGERQAAAVRLATVEMVAVPMVEEAMAAAAMVMVEVEMASAVLSEVEMVRAEVAMAMAEAVEEARATVEEAKAVVETGVVMAAAEREEAEQVAAKEVVRADSVPAVASAVAVCKAPSRPQIAGCDPCSLLTTILPQMWHRSCHPVRRRRTEPHGSPGCPSGSSGRWGCLTRRQLQSQRMCAQSR